jgi:hypothetical protein
MNVKNCMKVHNCLLDRTASLKLEEVTVIYNVKSCLKVNNGLLYRTVSLKLEGEVRLYTTKGAPGPAR